MSNKYSGATGSAIYAVGFFGAAYYYLSTAATFGLAVLGFIKSLVWPAFLVYELLRFLGA